MTCYASARILQPQLARAVLETLPRFQPRLKPKPAAKPLAPLDSKAAGWDAVNEAITNKLGLIASDFKPNGFTKKNHCCLNPQHEDKEASAGWSRDGNYYCFHCGKIDSWQVAEWLNIDWRALLKPQPQIVSSTTIDLSAAPEQAAATRQRRSPLISPPTAGCGCLIKFYKPTEAALFHFALRFCQSSPPWRGLHPRRIRPSRAPARLQYEGGYHQEILQIRGL